MLFRSPLFSFFLSFHCVPFVPFAAPLCMFTPERRPIDSRGSGKSAVGNGLLSVQAFSWCQNVPKRPSRRPNTRSVEMWLACKNGMPTGVRRRMPRSRLPCGSSCASPCACSPRASSRSFISTRHWLLRAAAELITSDEFAGDARQQMGAQIIGVAS